METVRQNPLDDFVLNPLSAPPELAVWCQSTWYGADQWDMFTHMPRVDMPSVWFYPLNYDLGAWPLPLGDNLSCALWECDGGPGGCDKSTPARPSASAGDDFLGQGNFSFADFKGKYSTSVPMYSRSGEVAGVVQVECPGCAAAWDKSPNWRSPYSKDATLPAGLRRSAPAPAPGLEAPAGTGAMAGLPFAAAPAPAYAATAQEVPPVALVPAIPASTGDSQQGQGQGVVAQQGLGDEPAVPADDDGQSAQPGTEAAAPAEGQQQQEEGSGSDDTVMIAVVASVCGVALLALLGLLCCFCRRRCCFRTRIQPQPTWPEDQMTVKNPAFEDNEKEARSIQVKVQRPREADQALHENDVPAGHVLIPGWEPAQPRPY